MRAPTIRDQLAASGVDTSKRFADVTHVDCLVGGSGHTMSVYLSGGWWCPTCRKGGDCADELWQAMADAKAASRMSIAKLLQPLFEEIPAMPPTVNIPLGAPEAYSRVVLGRAQGQCECSGQCGVAHARTAGRCPRRHGGWHAKKETVLALVPKKPLMPLAVAVTLPDSELMAECEECQRRAEKLAKELAKSP